VRQNQHTINLDICRRCHLVWFDKGELDAFPKTKVEQLPAHMKRHIALLKVQLEDERVQLEDTIDKVCGIIALRCFCWNWPLWLVAWTVSIYERVMDLAVDKKGWQWKIAGAICIIGLCIGIFVGIRAGFPPPEVAHPHNPFSPVYQRNMSYLLDATKNALPRPSRGRGGWMGSYLVIVDRKDFPRAAAQLEQQLRGAVKNDFFSYQIVLGGMNVRHVDQVLLDATKPLRLSERCDVEIFIVAPSTISDETQEILKERGLRIRRIASWRQ
jgi:hypothetical protein